MRRGAKEIALGITSSLSAGLEREREREKGEKAREKESESDSDWKAGAIVDELSGLRATHDTYSQGVRNLRAL